MICKSKTVHWEICTVYTLNCLIKYSLYWILELIKFVINFKGRETFWTIHFSLFTVYKKLPSYWTTPANSSLCFMRAGVAAMPSESSVGWYCSCENLFMSECQTSFSSVEIFVFACLCCEHYQNNREQQTYQYRVLIMI